MKYKRIAFLTDGFGNSAGEVVKVIEETDGEYYYYDGFHRWVYCWKKDENKEFIVIPAGQRLDSKLLLEKIQELEQ